MNNNFKYKLGIFSWFGFVQPLPDRLKLIKTAGFDATTIWWEDEIGSPNIKKETMPQIVRDSGLILENIHAPYQNCDDLWSDNKATRDTIVNQYINWLYDCAEFNIPVMVMHLTDAACRPAPNQYGLESISRLLKIAEELKIIIAIENIHREDYIYYVLSHFNSKYLKFCYDSSHNCLYSKEKLAIIENLKDRLVCTHLSDNDNQKDRHWLPGEGTIAWDKVMSALTQSNYTGILNLEVYPTPEELKGSPEDFITKAYQSAAWIRSLCNL